MCCVLTQQSLPHLPLCEGFLNQLAPIFFFFLPSLQATGEEIECGEFKRCSNDRGEFFFFFWFSRILSELHVSVQKTLDEDRLELSRETIYAILSYKKSLETPADRK